MHHIEDNNHRLRSVLAACAMIAGLALSSIAAAQIRISEFRIDHPGQAAGLADPHEFIELTGPAGTSLDGLQYIVVGDSGPEGGDSGVIEKIIQLHDQVIGPSGRFVIAQTGFDGNFNLQMNIDFEDGGTVTHMLVRNMAGSTTIDTEHDGFVDNEPWDQVLDAIAIVDPDDDTFPYGPGATCVSGTNCNLVEITTANPGHFYRCNGTGKWYEGTFDPDAASAADSPTTLNSCPVIFTNGFE